MNLNINRLYFVLRVRQLAVEVHIVPEGTTNELRDMVEIIQGIEDLGFVRFASNEIPSSRDWLEALQYDGCLDYDIVWYNSRLFSSPKKKNKFTKPSD